MSLAYIHGIIHFRVFDFCTFFVGIFCFIQKCHKNVQRKDFRPFGGHLNPIVTIYICFFSRFHHNICADVHRCDGICDTNCICYTLQKNDYCSNVASRYMVRKCYFFGKKIPILYVITSTKVGFGPSNSRCRDQKRHQPASCGKTLVIE